MNSKLILYGIIFLGPIRKLHKVIDHRLSKIFGHDDLKQKIKQFSQRTAFRRRRIQLGLETEADSNLINMCHMIFMGNPGVGKTEIARCMSGTVVVHKIFWSVQTFLKILILILMYLICLRFPKNDIICNQNDVT